MSIAEIIDAFGTIGGWLVGIAGILAVILEHRKKSAVEEYQKKEILKRLDEHNGYAEMFKESSERIAKIETEIAVIKNMLNFIIKEGEK